jgi:hypothetical protein
MKKEIVIFRKWKPSKYHWFLNNDIIALFPNDKNNKGYKVADFSHFGQFDESDYNFVISQTTLATEDEYKELKEEIESYGLKLEVHKKAKVRFDLNNK